MMSQPPNEQYYVGQFIQLKLTPMLNGYLINKNIKPMEFIKQPFKITNVVPLGTFSEPCIWIDTSRYNNIFGCDECLIYYREIKSIVGQLVFFPMD